MTDAREQASPWTGLDVRKPVAGIARCHRSPAAPG